MAAGDTSTAAGTKFYIGPASTLPASVASPDLWVTIGRIETAGVFGRSFSTFTFVDLDTRAEEMFKGIESAVTWDIGLGHQLSNAGQAALETALGTDFNYPFRVVLNDSSDQVTLHGTTYTFSGKVLQLQPGPFANNTVVKLAVRIGITAATYTRVAAS